MAKIKFKLSLKELNFEFEGDQEVGQRFQNSISKTLNSITETPNQVIDVEAKSVNDDYLLPQSSENSNTPKRKQRGKRLKAIDANATSSENGNGNLFEKTKRTNRPKGQSARDQVVVLIQSGFFSSYRSVADIQDSLSKKGHNFNSGEISPSLLRLTKKNYLIRDDSSGKWQYKKGEVDVPTKS
ncbi:MAG: hypothetical protein ACR2J3_13525 [Aridibacter sp.]